MFFFPHIQQTEAEFVRLTSVDLKGSIFAGLDKYLAGFLELYKAKSGIVGLTSLTRWLDDDVSVQLLVVVPCLPHLLLAFFRPYL